MQKLSFGSLSRYRGHRMNLAPPIALIEILAEMITKKRLPCEHRIFVIIFAIITKIIRIAEHFLCHVACRLVCIPVCKIANMRRRICFAKEHCLIPLHKIRKLGRANAPPFVCNEHGPFSGNF